jgi:SAM-dependent methyltransferase
MSLAARLHGKVVHRRRVEKLASAIAPLLSRGKLLDVGCGDGSLSVRLAELVSGLDVLGADIVSRPTTGIDVVQYDGRQLPFAEGSFDTVLLVDVLHHADAPEALIAECARVSRGSIIIKDHVRNSAFDQAVLSFMDFAGNAPYGIARTYRYLSPAQWDRLLAPLGVVETHAVRGLYPFPVSLVCGRGLHCLFKITLAGRRR